jgi:hypothetical protein
MVSLATTQSQSASWRLSSITRRPAGMWLIRLKAPDGVIHHATVSGRQLASWPIVQTCFFVQRDVWPSGFDRQSWRIAVSSHLAGRRGVRA